jgi:hypothetical protein
MVNSIQRAVKWGDPESHWPVEPYNTERKDSSYNYVVSPEFARKRSLEMLWDTNVVPVILYNLCFS